ncbi:MAG: hypothetical protein ACRC68_03305 [Clostridium sp.]
MYKNINSLSKQDLAKIILLEPDNKKWIYNRNIKQTIAKVLEQNIEVRKIKKKEEFENEKKKQLVLEEAARANNKPVICKICNKETREWRVYYGVDNSCKCRECFEMNLGKISEFGGNIRKNKRTSVRHRGYFE